MDRASTAGRTTSLPAADVLVAALPLPAVLIAPDGALLAGNTAALEFLARPGQTSLPAVFKELDAAQQISGLRATVDGVLGSGMPATLAAIEWRGRSIQISVNAVEAAGGRTALLMAASPTAAPPTAPEHLSTLHEELRVANETLAEQVDQLAEAEAADTRKNQFMAMLAHELRNPLGAVVNALHVIGRLAGGDRHVARAVRIAERQLRHEARLLDDLLDVSRIVLGKIVLKSELLDMREAVRSVVEGASFAVQSQALSLSMDLPDEPLMVAGDATRLEQCVGNLLNNAIKFTPAGGRLRVAAQADGGEAVVRVSDDGIGIPADMLERVFDLFAQADASPARSRGGLGIGLTLVRRLVELHGGRVTARSTGPGRGSEFEIRLRLVDATAVVAAPPRPPAAPGLHVLVVEDNRDAREMVRLVLEMEGHRVVDTGDAVSAVRLATESAPDAAVIDIGLPDLHGFEVARRLRARLGTRVRLIALTGYGDAESHARGREAGFDAHLVKPVEPPELLRALTRETAG